ncbi:D-alanyl-D-alanine carboxypeptidase [Clostridiaceae bacterium JG1575]|nr:D-alanyl-D-alanine carboxypeptidase [Clostridiaceae bacterium JG1575]
MKRLLSVLLLMLLLFFSAPQALAQPTKLIPVEPRIKAKAAISYDLRADEVILEKNMDEKMYPASLTKIMTALLLAEHAQEDTELTITKNALDAPAFSINTNLFILYEGDEITADACMKAILMPSANDMCIVAAEGVGGTVENFVALMNDRAQGLGMNNTHFTNPVGLHSDQHYTTARDLAILLKAAYANPWVRETLATQTTQIRTKHQPIGEIKSTNRLLGQGGNIGGKTGFTEEAGRCLAGIFVRDKREILQILLHDGSSLESTAVFTDMAALADEAYAMKKVPFLSKDSPVEGISVDYSLFRFFGPKRRMHLKATLQDDLLFYNNTLNNTGKELTPKVKPLKGLNVFSLREGDPVAQVSLSAGGKTLTSKALSATNTKDSVIIPNAVPYLALTVGAFLVLILLILILVRIIRTRRAVQERIHNKRKDNRRRAARYPQDNEPF